MFFFFPLFPLSVFALACVRVRVCSHQNGTACQMSSRPTLLNRERAFQAVDVAALQKHQNETRPEPFFLCFFFFFKHET